MTKLFDAYTLGEFTLNNRIVMAPMTRSRANAEGILGDITARYYEQRSGAGLIVTEATAVAKQGSGYCNIPGIWSDAQTKAWAAIPKAVHAKGGKIFMQLFHTGRIGHSSLYGAQPVSSSAVKPDGQVMATDFSMQAYEMPRALEEAEIPAIVGQFKTGAANAKKAGFDGIEIHAANGYLIDQFLRDGVNKRKDSYGGSAEKRARFLIEIVKATVDVFGPGRVGVRLSPQSGFNSMSDSDPVKTYTVIAKLLNDYPLAYVHMTENFNPSLPRVSETVRKIYKGTLIVNGGLTKDTGEKLLEEGQADLICYGIPFIANPDLVQRFRHNQPLAQPDQTLFYQGGEKGYIDYPAMDRKAA